MYSCVWDTGHENPQKVPKKQPLILKNADWLPRYVFKALLVQETLGLHKRTNKFDLQKTKLDYKKKLPRIKKHK